MSRPDRSDEILVRVFGWRNGYGLVQDSAIVGRLLEHWRAPHVRVEHCDPLTWMPPRDATGSVAHIHIYLEHPCRMAVPWSTYNVLVVNSEWYYTPAWDWCHQKGGMDLFVFKDPSAEGKFWAMVGGDNSRAEQIRTLVIPWRAETNGDGAGIRPWTERERRFLYLIGGSVNKAAAAEAIVAAWRPEWPPLEIWCAPAIADRLRPRLSAPEMEGAERVSFQTEYRPAAEKEARQRACAWHVVASEAEGFGFTMAEAIACGAPVLWTDLPVYQWMWGVALGATGRISTVPRLTGEGSVGRLDTGSCIESPEAIAIAVQSLLSLDADAVRRMQAGMTSRRSWGLREFRAGWEKVLQMGVRGAHASGVPRAPLRTRAGEEMPMVGVVTVTRNRRAWWPNMVENLQRQRWPVSRLVWVIVDDGDADQRLEMDVTELQRRLPALNLVYQVADRVATLGAKRDAGVAAAANAGAEYALMMDDDDHYPETSVPERMRWLMRCPGVSAVACSTLPMYDVTRYISAMNVPPLNLSPGERISEATMGFRIPASAGVFADVNMAEGEGLFKAFPVAATREIPPMGIIVSFIHTANSSSRRVPAETEANGCHYGFSDDYFRYIHMIGGVDT
jgi:glycosyltransferase involved in cell wall biosynthesis